MIQQHIENLAPSTAQKNINLSVLSTLQVICPPISDQKKFSKILEQADKSKFELRKSIEAIDAVIKSLING
jgi:type I restriction enzyme S subunit